MKLIYKKTGTELQVGDIVETSKGEQVEVIHFRPPHKRASSGKVTVKSPRGWSQEFYVGVIGCEWVEREDRQDEAGPAHKPICSEYWDRGLNCPCIPEGTTADEASDPSWGQFD